MSLAHGSTQPSTRLSALRRQARAIVDTISDRAREADMHANSSPQRVDLYIQAKQRIRTLAQELDLVNDEIRTLTDEQVSS